MRRQHAITYVAVSAAPAPKVPTKVSTKVRGLAATASRRRGRLACCTALSRPQSAAAVPPRCLPRCAALRPQAGLGLGTRILVALGWDHGGLVALPDLHGVWPAMRAFVEEGCVQTAA